MYSGALQSFPRALHVCRCTRTPCSTAEPRSSAAPLSPCLALPGLLPLRLSSGVWETSSLFPRFLNDPGKNLHPRPQVMLITHMICAAGLAFTLIRYLLNSTGCLSSSASHHLTNRARHSCACGCGSEEGARAMEGWPREEPGLGGVRRGSGARCGWRGIRRTAGSSQQKNTWTAGCRARPAGAWPWAALAGPG